MLNYSEHLQGAQAGLTVPNTAVVYFYHLFVQAGQHLVLDMGEEQEGKGESGEAV